MPSRAYAVFLRCFPRDFRVRHASAMAAQFEEQRRATAGRPLARIALWVRAMSDAARHGFALRFGSQRPPGRPSPLPADVRQAWRSLRARPGHAMTSVALLAIALSVSTGVFAIVDAEILTPSPFPDSAALVELFNAEAPHRPDNKYMPLGLVRGWLAQPTLFRSAGAYAQGGSAVLGDDQTGRQNVGVAYCEPGLFQTLGIAPIAGRTFADGEGQPGRDRIVVISESIWVARFNRNPAAIGQTLVVNDTPDTIIGIMPASFAFPFALVKVWLPMDLRQVTGGRRQAEIVARSRFGGDRRALEDRVTAIAPGLIAQTTQAWRYPTATIRGLDQNSFASPRSRQSIIVLACATLLLLMTAAANLSTLTMTQMLARTRQMAIQSALGASRARLVRQALFEQLLVGLAGALAAAPLAWAAVRLSQTLGPDIFTKWTMHLVTLDARSVLVLGTLALATPVLTGLLPALAGSRTSVVELLKQDTRAQTGSRRSRLLRRGLVTIEIVCAVVLLVAGALLVRSFLRLQAVDRGFDTRHVIYAGVSFPTRAFPSPLSRRLFADQVIDRLAAMPGVAGVTLSGGVPPDSSISFGNLALDGLPETSRRLELPFYNVRPSFFAITGIPILQGRPFAGGEPDTDAIVSESFAAAAWPGSSPIGHRFRIGSDDSWHEVVGVAGEVRSMGLDDAVSPYEVYYPYPRVDLSKVSAQPDRTTAAFSGIATFLVRATNASAVIPLVREAIAASDRRISIDKVETVEDLYQTSLSEPRMLLVLMSIFSVAGLLVAGVGVYGVLSTLVAQQLREIGVRLMLGAEPIALSRRVFRGGLALAGAGAGVGVVVAVLSSRLISSVLFDVQTIDVASYVVVTAVIGITTIAAAWLPAQRAAKADPAALLRDS